MLEVIEELDRNTIAKDNGLKSSNEAMNHFCALIIKNRKKCDPDVFLNRLEWVTSYSDLNEDLRRFADKKIRETEAILSQNRVFETSTRVR